MSNGYSEIKYILMGLEDVSNVQYGRLVDVYGRELVNQVLKDLREGNSNDEKIDDEEYELDEKLKDAYEYYSKDIDNIVEISSFEKNKLLKRIFEIISDLNELFSKVYDFDKDYGNKSKPWISDKVEYCLSNCDDKDLLYKINVLYKEYVSKRDILVESNLKFVIYIVKKEFKSDNRSSFNDFIQDGNLGLIRAIETYNPEYDIEFVTYAGYWIKQSIIKSSKKMMYPYHIPMHLFNDNHKLLSIIEQLTYDLGRFPTYLEIAGYVGISLEKVKYILEVFAPVVCLDDDMDIDNEEEMKKELIVDNKIDLEKEMFDKSFSTELKEIMDMCLDERQIFILRNIYGFDGEMTQAKLGEILGISSQRVDQIKQRTLTKLYTNVLRRDLKEYLR